MKKFFILAAVVATASFTSCKKDHTCTCTTTYTNGGASFSDTDTWQITDARKGDARAACLSTSSTDDNGGTTKTECSLN